MKFVPFIWSENNKQTEKDSVYGFKSKWPIYCLSLKSLNGIWKSLDDKIDWCSNKKILKTIDTDDIDCFLDKNLDIKFEIEIFQENLSEIFFLKIFNEIYCYTTNDFNENDEYVNVRFYFDIENFLLVGLS